MDKPDRVEHTILAIENLKPSPYNPRTISDEALDGLEVSLKKFGLVQEVVVNKRTMHVIGGNQRLAVLRRGGITNINVALVDLDDDEEKALNIALNNPEIQGEFTPDIKNLLSELSSELTEGLRTNELMESLEQKLAEGDDEFKRQFALDEMKVAPPPKMVWALVAVPTERWPEVSEFMEKVSKTPGVKYDSVVR